MVKKCNYTGLSKVAFRQDRKVRSGTKMINEVTPVNMVTPHETMHHDVRNKGLIMTT